MSTPHPHPKISQVTEQNGILRFRISGVDVSLANAIRRCLLTDIPVMGFSSTSMEITKNTCSHMHNQVLQSRFENIPILLSPATPLDAYEVLLDITNTTDTLREVSTDDFQIINLLNKKNESDLTRVWFPRAFPLLQLQARVSDTIQGESIQLRCRPQLVTAKKNASYVAANASLAGAPDQDQIAEQRTKKEKEWGGNFSTQELSAKLQDWQLLEGARLCLPDTFDMWVESYGFYSNRELVSQACALLAQGLREFIIGMNHDRQEHVVITANQTQTFPNGWDILLEMDASLANILHHFLYTNYFLNEKSFSFCACTQAHPYDTFMTLRIACVNEMDTATHLKEKMEKCAQIGISVLEAIQKAF